ncbi:MAG: hypothetical protein J7545_22085 [Roseofilum sp. SBFL]|nr:MULTISPECIES: hypothetical protein [unclassified Roseofilum]MBP0015184.1 hypothetical protein [Roseofilum sp. SID3]MBP0024460.1 hypothetical protein [Roseofilum sp. SID2]MBP0038737.1 hypothetical protein [Roseofilum sp. SID1]MBP0044628.1 hypothetical protein [Roseofilum sp. SBFL]
MTNKYISSEDYRKMLVRDGDRRFQEWHSQYLHYQKQYWNQLVKGRKVK